MMESDAPREDHAPDERIRDRQPARAARLNAPAERPPAAHEPAPLQNRPPPDWAEAQPEFEDEEPGSYLVELSVGGWSVVWAAVNLLVTTWIGVQARVSGVSEEWRFLADVVWKLLPLSGGLLVVITLWQLATTYMRNSPRKSRWTLALSFVGFLLWCVLGPFVTP